MKKYLFLIIALFSIKAAIAQQDSLPVYKRFPTVPPFNIIKYPDSTHFAKADLKKKKATLIMVFSPDCEHCQHATQDMLDHTSLFKNVQIIMATPLEYRFIPPFYERFKIAEHSNITMGWDATYFFGTFYGITNYPSIFLYNKKGKFVQGFEGSISFEKIATYL